MAPIRTYTDWNKRSSDAEEQREPLQSATQSAPKQSGVTTEQRAEHGVTHETFTKNDGKSDEK